MKGITFISTQVKRNIQIEGITYVIKGITRLEIDRKLGYSEKHSTSSRLIKTKEERERFAVSADISTGVIQDTLTCPNFGHVDFID